MSFLMGLNDSFSQIRTQLLLMEPEPTLQKVFSLVVQEVEQRTSTSQLSTPNLPINSENSAMLVKNISQNPPQSRSNPSKKKDRPVCSHYNIPDHTAEKCYCLHGFPPGYKTNRNSKTEPTTTTPAHTDSLSNMNVEQCQSLLTILQSHLAKIKTEPIATSLPSSSSAASSSFHVAGTCYHLSKSISHLSY